MSDDDLIRRGDAMHIVEGWRVLEDDIEALPAAPTFTAADLERAWQPIETAPNDQDILVWYDNDLDPFYQQYPDEHKLTDYATWAEGGDFLDGKGICIAKWFSRHWENTDEYGSGYWLPAWWFAKENDDYERVCNPTHWMPLPPPPADLAQRVKKGPAHD